MCVLCLVLYVFMSCALYVCSAFLWVHSVYVIRLYMCVVCVSCAFIFFVLYLFLAKVFFIVVHSHVLVALSPYVERITIKCVTFCRYIRTVLCAYIVGLMDVCVRIVLQVRV